MSWCYALMKHKTKWHGKTCIHYEVHEIFQKSKKNKKFLWTQESLTTIGDNKREVISKLKMMLSDIKSSPIFDFATGKEVEK